MLNPELLKILACPVCKSELKYDAKAEKLLCYQCKLKYSVDQGVPIMLPDQAEKF